MGMIFVKEYTAEVKTAHVFQREQQDFVVMCYNLSDEAEHGPFDTEQLAFEHAEEFVSTTDNQEQQTAVTRGCCD